jgi:hypothetical protein
MLAQEHPGTAGWWGGAEVRWRGGVEVRRKKRIASGARSSSHPRYTGSCSAQHPVLDAPAPVPGPPPGTAPPLPHTYLKCSRPSGVVL